MPLNINAPSVISGFWTAFKASVASKLLLMQYDDDGVVYSIFAFDGPSIAYVTIIWKGTVPNNVIAAGYAQATNDADKSDFETNYKANANKPIGLQISRDGQTIASNPVLVAGQDGTNAQSIATDGYGRVQVAITGSSTSQVEGRAADGATPVGNPVLIGGFDGTNAQTILTDSSGRIVTAPAGASTTSGFSFGDVALSSITTSVVRRTTYTEQSANAQRSVASSSANDTNSAGTGARQIKITYYDSTGAGPSTETINLNGTANVNTVSTTICFIEKIEVVSVGSGGSNAGTITLFAATAGGGGAVGTIAVGDNRTYWAHHYVATGKTLYITSQSVVVNGGGALFFLKGKTIGVATAVEAQISDYVRSATQSGTNTRNYGTPIQLVGPGRIIMYVTTEANTSLTYRGAFDYYEQ
jgi:hypothetical protein